MHYYQHHIGDYRRDTSHLSLIEHGVYRQILDMYYLSETKIPEETEVVYRRLCARTDDEKKAVDFILSEFFTWDDGWIQVRCEKEIRLYQLKADRARDNGKLGGRPNKTKVVNSGLQELTQEKANSLTHKPINKELNNTKKRTKDFESAIALSPNKDLSDSKLLNSEIWKSYTEAYSARYGADPVRNAKINGQVSQLGKRLGRDAPLVAAWFLGHSNSWYSQKMHSLDCLLSDAEKLRTEWATGRTTTQATSRQIDRTQSNLNALEQAKLMMRKSNEG